MASIAIAAGWLKSGQDASVNYVAAAQPPDEVRARLSHLGLDAHELESRFVDSEYEKLQIFDWYTVALGMKSKEKHAWGSLKVQDISVIVSRDDMRRPQSPNHMIIVDDESCLFRFNEEKAWVELELTRFLPVVKVRKMISITGVMTGVHSEWVYKRLEAANDCVIDFRLDDRSDPPRNLMRIRSMRDLGFDGRWHQLNIGENFEVTLEK